MSSITLNVKGMSCEHCVKAVEGALQEAGASGKVNLASGTVEVNYDENKVSVDKLKEAIEDQGYDVV